MAARACRPLLGENGEAPARRIAILAGAGVEHGDAAERLRSLAERFVIPVATTLRAKGVLAEDHPLSLGVFGYAGTRHASAALLLQDIELLFVLGSGLNERDTMHWSARLAPKRGVVAVNLSAKSLAREVGPDCGVVARRRRLHRCPRRSALRDGAGSWHRSAQDLARRNPLRSASLRHRASRKPADPYSSGTRRRRAAQGAASRRHRARQFGRASRFRGPLFRRLCAAHVHLSHQSRPDGMGHSGCGRRRLRAARHAGRSDHRRRLHADARHRDRGRGALSLADRLCRAQQRRARQCLAARPHARAGPRRTHQHPRSRLGVASRAASGSRPQP